MKPSASPAPLRIGVAWSDPAQRHPAEQLARSLGLPAAETAEHWDVILRLTPHSLELLFPGHPSLTGPVRADFVRGPSGYRRRHGGGETLIRALGHKTSRRTVVMDATGGWGDDALVMAAHGCEVHLVERNPVVAALLHDGLRRAAGHPDTEQIVRRIRLITGNSLDVMRQFRQAGRRVDVVYLDPMFPVRRKSAKVKKKLQMLQLLIGPEEDGDSLLPAALQTAQGRVVVKRPLPAPFLAGIRPSHSYRGRTTRFDVYRQDGFTDEEAGPSD